jgi:hypothetical protein
VPWRGPSHPGEFPSLGWEIGAWIEENCVIPDGDHLGEPYRLTDEMWTFFVWHYRLKTDATEDDWAAAWTYRRSQLVRPQKWGKGPLSAAQVCAEAVGPVRFAGWDAAGEPVGQPWATPWIQITATSEDQTDNVYRALQPMIEEGPLADVIPDTGVTRINVPGGGLIEPVTSSKNARLGQRITFSVQDETHCWLQANGGWAIASTQRRNLAGTGGRSAETTNAWDPSEQSVAQRTSESTSQDIYRDHRMAPPVPLTNRAERRRALRIAYGDSAKRPGGWVSIDRIDGELLEIAEKDEAQAERYFLNRIVAGTGSWVDRDEWDALAAPRALGRKPRVVLGFDGSEVDDWTGIRAETMDGYQFTPTYGPDARPCIWNAKDWGGRMPYSEVNAAMDHLMNHFDVVRAYCDPRYWETEIDNWAAAHGTEKVVRWFTHRDVPMHAAAERLLTDVTKEGTNFRHDGCKTTAIHVANARKAARPKDRYVLKKASTAQKIDLAMCSILAHEAAGDAIAAGLAQPRKRGRIVVM